MIKTNFFVDSSISLLKAIKRNNLIFGLYLILQGFFLAIGNKEMFNIISILGILITIAIVLEILIRIFKGEKTLFNKILRIASIIVIVFVVIILIYMLINSSLSLKVDLALISISAIIDGIVNSFQVIKFEKNKILKIILLLFSIMSLIFGIAYGFSYTKAPELLTSARGIVILLCGLINMWMAFRVGIKKTT